MWATNAQATALAMVASTNAELRARIRLFGLIDQNASESWLDTGCRFSVLRRSAPTIPPPIKRPELFKRDDIG